MKKLKKLLSTNNQELAAQIAATQNPYLKARLEWNELWGDTLKAKSQWRWIACLALLANSFLVLGLIFLSLKSQYLPYVVKVDDLGNALYGGFLNQEKTITPLEINAFLRNYLVNARSVMLDAFAEKRSIDFVYSVSLPPARKLLDDYYRNNNPFVVSQQELVEVQIKGVVQKSSKTWQVDWEEIHRSSEGELLKQTRFEALITIAHLSVKNVELLNSNPLGIYIQHISWAEQK